MDNKIKLEIDMDNKLEIDMDNKLEIDMVMDNKLEISSSDIQVEESNEWAKLNVSHVDAYNQLKQWIKISYGGKVGFILRDETYPLESFHDVTNWLNRFESLGELITLKGQRMKIVNWAKANMDCYVADSWEDRDPGVNDVNKTYNVCRYGKAKNITHHDFTEAELVKARDVWMEFMKQFTFKDETDEVMLSRWIAWTCGTNQINRTLLILRGPKGSGKTSIERVIKMMLNGAAGQILENSSFDGNLLGCRLFFQSETGEQIRGSAWEKIKGWAGANTITLNQKNLPAKLVNQSPCVMLSTNHEFPVSDRDGETGGTDRMSFCTFTERMKTDKYEEIIKEVDKHKKAIIAVLASQYNAKHILMPDGTIQFQYLTTGEWHNQLKKYASKDIEEAREFDLSVLEQIMKERIDSDNDGGFEGWIYRGSFDAQHQFYGKTLIDFKHPYKEICSLDGAAKMKRSTLKQYVCNVMSFYGFKKYVDRNDKLWLVKD